MSASRFFKSRHLLARYSGPIYKVFTGDAQIAASYLPIARSILGAIWFQAQEHNLGTISRTVRIRDGTIINVSIEGGLKKVAIDVTRRVSISVTMRGLVCNPGIYKFAPDPQGHGDWLNFQFDGNHPEVLLAWDENNGVYVPGYYGDQYGKSYRPVFPNGIEYGIHDWRGPVVEGTCLSWNGMYGRSLWTNDFGPGTGEYKIFQNGFVLANCPFQVGGCALTVLQRDNDRVPTPYIVSASRDGDIWVRPYLGADTDWIKVGTPSYDDQIEDIVEHMKCNFFFSASGRECKAVRPVMRNYTYLDNIGDSHNVVIFDLILVTAKISETGTVAYTYELQPRVTATISVTESVDRQIGIWSCGPLYMAYYVGETWGNPMPFWWRKWSRTDSVTATDTVAIEMVGNDIIIGVDYDGDTPIYAKLKVESSTNAYAGSPSGYSYTLFAKDAVLVSDYSPDDFDEHGFIPGSTDLLAKFHPTFLIDRQFTQYKFTKEKITLIVNGDEFIVKDYETDLEHYSDHKEHDEYMPERDSNRTTDIRGGTLVGLAYIDIRTKTVLVHSVVGDYRVESESNLIVESLKDHLGHYEGTSSTNFHDDVSVKRKRLGGGDDETEYATDSRDYAMLPGNPNHLDFSLSNTEFDWYRTGESPGIYPGESTYSYTITRECPAFFFQIWAYRGHQITWNTLMEYVPAGFSKVYLFGGTMPSLAWDDHATLVGWRNVQTKGFGYYFAGGEESGVKVPTYPWTSLFVTGGITEDKGDFAELTGYDLDTEIHMPAGGERRFYFPVGVV